MISIALLFLMLSSCGEPEKPLPASSVLIGNAMTMDWKVVVGCPLSLVDEERVLSIIQRTFEEIDLSFNCFNPYSELSLLNQLPANQVVPLSAKMAAFLEKTARIVELSKGRFDPTVAPLCHLWKNSLQRGRWPDDGELQPLFEAVGWEKIHFYPLSSDEEASRKASKTFWFYKEKGAVALDLSGIAKGYAIDLIVDRLHAIGFDHLFVEWGGEIRALGHHPDLRPWRVSILGVGGSHSSFGEIDLHNQAIATSGDYLQYWNMREGNKWRSFSHIIDPASRKPMEIHPGAIASVSVRANSCAFADGLATAAMLFPSIEEAELWAKSLQTEFPELQFWFIKR